MDWEMRMGIRTCFRIDIVLNSTFPALFPPLIKSAKLGPRSFVL
uniref:Uncharacterized protein n=1 Tax=Anguilla anguilla TaxID=7936 RepID=A0A0E9W8Q5_ANGAN